MTIDIDNLSREEMEWLYSKIETILEDYSHNPGFNKPIDVTVSTRENSTIWSY